MHKQTVSDKLFSFSSNNKSVYFITYLVNYQVSYLIMEDSFLENKVLTMQNGDNQDK